MRIDSTNTQAPLTPTAATRPGTRTSESTSAPTVGTEAFEVTGELASLLAAVRRVPEVRADVIESVAARVASGELSTPQAAADAAKALLDEGACENC